MSSVRAGHSAITGKKGSDAAFEYRVLEAATNNFHGSKLLGEADNGRLYRAYINEKLPVIIKRLNADDQDMERQFEVFFFLKKLLQFLHNLSIFLPKHLTLNKNIRTGRNALVEQNPPSECNFPLGLLRSWGDEVSHV